MSEMIYVDRTTTWHAIGKSVRECKDVRHVLKESGLDYDVTVLPVAAMVPDEGYRTIPNRMVTVRPDDKEGIHMYGVVSDKFQIIQNRDAFDFVDYMGDEVQFEKAGETQSGMVYIIAKLPSVNILGDEFTPHVIFRNGFNGKTKITAAICPLRLVCQNQFNFAFKEAQNAVTIRHVGNAEAKLAEARDVLKMSADYMAHLNKVAEKYASMKLTAGQAGMVLDTLFPMDDDAPMNAYKRAKLEQARADFLRAYERPDNGNFRGTAWGIINAYTDFITHKRPGGKAEVRDENRFMAVTFNPAMMNTILALLPKVA